jgi:hypothetical protein
MTEEEHRTHMQVTDEKNPPEFYKEYVEGTAAELEVEVEVEVDLHFSLSHCVSLSHTFCALFLSLFSL